MQPSVAEIGRIVGCSPATVSRALNNSGPVSSRTREAVLKAMRETRTAPARTARRGRPTSHDKARQSGLVEILYFRGTPVERLSVREGKLEVGPYGPCNGSDMIASSNEISGSFYRRILDGAGAELADWGYRTTVQSTTDLTSDEALAEVNRPDRAGILLMGEYDESIQRFVECCMHPLVLVDLIRPCGADVVTTDNQAGIGLAFDHLYSLGHRKIGFVGKRVEDGGCMERFLAFKLKMAEVGLPVRPEWIYEGPTRIDLTEAAVMKMLALPDRPTALLCKNDCEALGVIRAASRLNLRIPKDLSVTGFDDDEFAVLSTPPLTTVRTPVAEIGRQSARQLMLQIQHPRKSGFGCWVRLRPELVIRESTATPA